MDPLETAAQRIQDELPEGVTICTAESLTGGLVGNMFTRVDGSSAYFVGSTCAYNINQKVDILGVDRVQAEACDCVSQTVAEQMALGAIRHHGATLALSCTGYVKATDTIPAPYCFWAIALPGRVKVRGRFVGHPEWTRAQMQEAVALHLAAHLLRVFQSLR